MGTSTSKYIRKKKVSDEQRRRNENAIKKLQEISKKNKK